MSEGSGRPVLKAIVAMASNRVIGRDGNLPWRLPEDLKWFKKLTLGHPILMGRKTMDSLPGALPKRRNVVISRSLEEAPEGFELVSGCEEAIEMLADEECVFVIGGAQIYAELLPQCDEV
ncbi:MAG: dihydrofolate reductase, partial [Verrucomicrobiota bacterium]